MESKLKDVLLSTFKPIGEDEDGGLDERFYEFIDDETLNEFLNLVSV